jgi:hypothetical protein
VTGKSALDELYEEAETLRKEWEKNEKEKIPALLIMILLRARASSR